MFYVAARQSVGHICVRARVQTLLERKQSVLGSDLRSEVPPVSRACEKTLRREKIVGDYTSAIVGKVDEKGAKKEGFFKLCFSRKSWIGRRYRN